MSDSVAAVQLSRFSGGSVGAKIAKALLAAQKTIDSASKNASNPHFGNDFANLESVIDAVKGPLNEQGIVFVQVPHPTDGETLGLTTLLIHESGEYIGGTVMMPLQKTDPQGYGSAITYARRYSLASVVGLKTVDDDAEGAVGRGANNTKPAVTGTPKFSLGGGNKMATQPIKAPARGKTGMFPKVSTNDNAE